jgi:hypothetical protein
MAKKIKKSKKGSSSEKTTRKPKNLQIDFTGVEGKRGRRVPEGDYLLKVKDYAVSPADDDPGWIRIENTIKKGPTDGDYSEMYSLSQKALFRLRNFFEAIGLKVPSSVTKVPLEKIVGRSYAASIADHTYDNKTKSQIQDWFPKDEYEALAAGTIDEDDDEDEDEDEEEEEDEDADLTEETDEDEDEEIEVDDDDI